VIACMRDTRCGIVWFARVVVRRHVRHSVARAASFPSKRKSRTKMLRSFCVCSGPVLGVVWVPFVCPPLDVGVGELIRLRKRGGWRVSSKTPCVIRSFMSAAAFWLAGFSLSSEAIFSFRSCRPVVSYVI